MERHEIQVLRKAGQSFRAISRQTGISKRSVRRICRETPVAEVDPAAPCESSSVGRPSVVEPFHDRLVALLAAEPDLPTVEILHRFRQSGYAGGKTALYEMVRFLRPKSTVPLVRFEGLPGEFSQHDFGEVQVRYLFGKSERIHFFASRLKYSRFMDVRVVPDQKVEALVRSLLLSFETFGGVPLVAVFDNPKTVVLDRQGSRIQWNDTFGQVALDYRFAPELCTPGRGQEKGSVENLVGFVKNNFFKVRRFQDREDLLQQLADWLLEVNTVRPCRATGVPPQERMTVERERLRPLPIPAADYALRFPIVVGPTGLVEFEGRRYSMAPEAIGIPGSLWLYTDRLRIVASRHLSEHPRVPEHGRDSIHPGHRTERLAKVAGERGRLYLKRQEILDLGPVAETFLTELVHRHRHTWKSEVEQLHTALVSHGPARLHESISQACDQGLFGARYVLDLLEQEVA